MFMKRYVLVSLLVIIITLVGCQSNIETIPNAKMFSINVDAPKDLQADELFIVKGTLVNNSDSTWEVEHGADMFTYVVYHNGEPVLQDVKLRVVNDIGLMMSLKPDATYKYDGEGHVNPKNNEFILQAGNYDVVSKAKFRIKHVDKYYEFEIESQPLKIKVS
ncbi:hypothetical protein QFZ78_001128 [Paenibacillus sp. V4I5]|nr:hypothetical protein [Paenibacillus sp. V4I5]